MCLEVDVKIAIIGSRSIKEVDLEAYLPLGVSEIVSGAADGVDTYAAEYARANGIALKEFLPDYRRYKAGAPMRRNQQIAEYADEVIAFWDGKSKGTQKTVEMFKKMNKPAKIILM